MPLHFHLKMTPHFVKGRVEISRNIARVEISRNIARVSSYFSNIS